jgi:hypothetical protein
VLLAWRLVQPFFTSAWGRQLAVAFLESCRWIGAFPGAQTNDWFRRRSISTLTLVNGR